MVATRRCRYTAQSAALTNLDRTSTIATPGGGTPDPPTPLITSETFVGKSDLYSVFGWNN